MRTVCEDVPKNVCETVLEKSCRTVQEQKKTKTLFLLKKAILKWLITQQNYSD